MFSVLRNKIESEYGLSVKALALAPRQFVAETYVVQLESNAKYFCKVVTKPVWIPKIIASLPTLNAMKDAGIERIGYPVHTKNHELYVKDNDELIILFNYIEGAQSYDYDYYTFGKLLGEIHQITNKIETDIPVESFKFDIKDVFEKQYNDILASKEKNPVAQYLKEVLKQNKEEIDKYYEVLQKLIAQTPRTKTDLVITHGDAGGNVLVKFPTDIYIIDWDEILLAPRERDLWVLEHESKFVAGYKSVVPNFAVNEIARDFCIVNQYFYYIAYYFDEILGDGSEGYKREKLKSFSDFFTGWIKPYINRAAEAYLT